MKKLSIAFMVFVLAFAVSSFNADAIGITIKVEFGKRNAEGNCGPGKGICSVTLGASLRSATGETDAQVLKGEAELKDGQLTVKLPERIDERGMDEKGNYTFKIDKITTVDQALAKELGVTSLTILPGQYKIENNTFVLRVKSGSPRDAASGLPTGKRSH